MKEQHTNSRVMYKGHKAMYYRDQALKSIAHGALTNSKRPECLINGVYPYHATHGSGSYIVDAKGDKYIDFICGLGVNLIGYGNEKIAKAIYDQYLKGTCYSIGSVLEVEAANKVKQMFPFIHLLRFLKTGSEACSSAIKIARAFHGVKYDENRMFKMQKAVRFMQLLQRQDKENRSSSCLQDLCKGISETIICNGNKKKSAEKICKDEKRNYYREETCTEKAKKNNVIKQECSIQGCENFIEKALQDLWCNECTRSPRGLYEALRDYLAMPAAPRRRPPRHLVLTDGYHGHLEPFAGQVPPALGANYDPFMLNLKGNEDLIPEAAAVIIEPIVTDISKERIEYLNTLREICTQSATILIFDEIITGFRFPSYSASTYYGITPDLIIFGKAFAAGLPLSIVGGHKDIMNCGEYFVSSTYAGDTLALRAFMEQFKLFNNGRYDLEYLWLKGEKFINNFNTLHESVKIEGYPTRGVFTGDPMAKRLLWQEAALSHILLGPSFFFNFNHIGKEEMVLSHFKDIFYRIDNGLVEPKGEPPKTPFAKEVRDGL